MADGNPSISCIIPAYNSQSWIRETIDSAINQTVPFDEIIVINDGSTDLTLSIGEEYNNKYSYVKLISHENRGLAACRNEGLAITYCDYVMFLDSDDLFANDTVEQLLQHLVRKPDCIYFDAETFGDDSQALKGNRYKRIENAPLIETSGKSFFEYYYPYSFIACAPLAIYKKSFLEKERIIFPKGIIFEDNIFSFKCALKAVSVVYLPKELYKRRLRAGSITTTEFDEKKLRDLLTCAGMIMDFTLNLDEKDLSKEIVRYILNWGSILVSRYNQCRIARTDAAIKKALADVILGICNIVSRFAGNEEDMNVLRINLFQILSFCKCENLDKERLLLDEYEKLYLWARDFYTHYYDRIGLGALDDNLVAIYGVGKFTKGMTRVYEQLYKRHVPKVVYIDKNKAGETFRNSTIKSIEGVEGIEKVIISVLSPESYKISDYFQDMFPGIEIMNLYDIYPYNLFSLDEYLFV